MLKTFTSRLEKIAEHFNEDLKSVRTGRANPALVANIMVAAYGTQTPLAQLANISVPEAKLLVIEAWDKSLLKEIEKAIINSSLNMTPVSDGNILRLKLPDLTEETRRALIKVVREKLEQARMTIRQARDEVKKDIEKDAKSGAITEDDRYDSIEKLDKQTKETVAKLESVVEQKEKEVMTI
ncbi:MAG: ribosome recycling factor [Candidatus Komeilibacteria bacterium]|nr:ribosome recycling factor [Candidatus Komeilibacteria bacterium]